jgi:hypothetical protein
MTPQSDGYHVAGGVFQAGLDRQRGRCHSLLSANHSFCGFVVDLLFANPVITVRHVLRMLDVSQPGAANLLRTLTDFGIVREVGVGPEVRHRWFADEILNALDTERSRTP